MVLIQAEFCAGGSLQDHLNRLLACSRMSTTGGGGGRGGVGWSRGHGNGSYDREVMGPRRKKVYTPEAEAMIKAEEEKEEEKRRRGAGQLPARYLARRLEVWVRQVKYRPRAGAVRAVKGERTRVSRR